MNFLVILAVVGTCAASPALLYTPEVNAARAQFFTAYRAAQAASRPNTQQAIVFQDFSAPQPTGRWTGPLAAALPAGVPGSVSQVAQTADVAAATAEFQRAYEAAVFATTGRRAFVSAPAFPAPVYVQSSNAIISQPRWTGPVAATIPAGVVGSTNVIDTAEVAAAKRAFHNAFASQLASVGGPVLSRF